MHLSVCVWCLFCICCILVLAWQAGSPLRMSHLMVFGRKQNCFCPRFSRSCLSFSFSGFVVLSFQLGQPSFSLFHLRNDPSFPFGPSASFCPTSDALTLAAWSSWLGGTLTVSVCLNSWWTDLLAGCGNRWLASTTCGPSVYLSPCTLCQSFILPFFLGPFHLYFSAVTCQGSSFVGMKKLFFVLSSHLQICHLLYLVSVSVVLFNSVVTPPICWCRDHSER